MPRLLVLATFFATSFVLAACANDTPAQQPPAAGETQETDAIPFRKDGTLDFIRDGEVILTLDIEIAEGDIDIGQQTIAKSERLHECVVKHLPRLSKTPYLTRGIRAMRTKHRQECRILEPSHIQFSISEVINALIVIPIPEPEIGVVFYEKSTNVCRPIG
jgi:hypothetical protein